MPRPHMVRHNIEQNFHLLLVRRRNQFLIIPQRPQVRIDRIQIHRPVTVVILRGPILHHRREPNRRHAEILQIRQVLAHPA